MVFNSLFGFKRSDEAREAEPRDTDSTGDGTRKRTDGKNLGQDKDQQGRNEDEEYSMRQQSYSLSEAESRILKAVSKSSINSTDDGKEIGNTLGL